MIFFLKKINFNIHVPYNSLNTYLINVRSLPDRNFKKYIVRPVSPITAFLHENLLSNEHNLFIHEECFYQQNLF